MGEPSELEKAAALAAQEFVHQEARNRGTEMPEGPVAAVPSAATGPHRAVEPADAPDDIFSVADLAQVELYPAREFAMPGGKKLWVHRTAPDEAVWLNLQALHEVRKGEFDSEQDAELVRLSWARAYQVMVCCRVGPDPTAPRAFWRREWDRLPEREKAEALRGVAEMLRRNLSHDHLARICALSDRIGGDEAALEKLILDFFGATALLARTLSSRLSEGSSDSCRQALETFGSCVSRIARRRSLDSQDLAAVRELAASGEVA